VVAGLPVRHTRAHARERNIAGLIGLRSPFTLRAQPRHLIALVRPTRHPFDDGGSI